MREPRAPRFTAVVIEPTRRARGPLPLLAAIATSALLACGASGSREAATPSAPNASITPAPPFAVGAPWPNVKLPRSAIAARAPSGALRVALNREALLVEGAELPIATRPRVGRAGFDARYKGSGEATSIEISPLRRVLAATAAESKGGKAGPLLLGLDDDVTYRTFTEVVFSTMQAGYVDLWLAVDTNAGERAIAFPAPRSSRGDAKAWDALVVIVGQDGFYLKASQQLVSRDCGEREGMVTIPRVGGYDYAGLGACAATLKRGPRLPAGSETVLLTAGSDIELGVLVNAMDALRADGATPLFPNVIFTVLGGAK